MDRNFPYKRTRQYALTLSRMSWLQIGWRLRRVALQRWWRVRPAISPSPVTLDLLDPSPPLFGHAPPIPEDHPATTNAQAICRGSFTFLNQTVTFASRLPDWSTSPDGDRLWSYNLHYFEYGRDLLWAYRSTGHEDYLRCLIRLIQHWIDQNPFWTAVAWEPYTISKRLISWSILLGHLHDDHLFHRECLAVMLASMVQQAKFLARNVEYDVDNNHLITNARALITTGLLLTGHPQAQRWYNQGLTLLQEHAKRQILADGGHCERSLSYQMVVLQELLETSHLLKQANEPVPPDLSKATEALYAFLVHFVKLDGTLPMLNDTVRGYPVPTADLITVSAILLQKPKPDMGTCQTAGDYLDWIIGANDWATGCTLPICQNSRSVALKESGYFIMRAGQGDDAHYLVFDCGLIGPRHSAAHAHADTLSFELTAFNQTLVIDPGVYEYKAGKWRDYFRSTTAHNTVTVDEQDQSVFWGSFRVAEMAEARLLHWESNDIYDYVEGEHNGYNRLKSPVTHRRSIRFIKPDQWVIQDTLETDGQVEHQYQLNFHLTPAAQVTIMDKNRCRATFPKGVTLDFAAQHPPDTAVAIEKGWLSLTWKQKVVIPVLRYSLITSAPTTIFETVLTVSQKPRDRTI
jgi:uncharacterized heparinase superfamily protein